tara:strand:+ start:142 stop:297 length:156 start_codon:yes stop_codon:yes gene_type:complete
MIINIYFFILSINIFQVLIPPHKRYNANKQMKYILGTDAQVKNPKYTNKIE